MMLKKSLMLLTLFLLAFTTVSANSAAWAQEAATPAAAVSAYRLGAGDRMHISVFGAGDITAAR